MAENIKKILKKFAFFPENNTTNMENTSSRVGIKKEFIYILKLEMKNKS